MPAYLTLTIQRKTNKLTSDYVKQIYMEIIHSGYPFKSGYWFHENTSFQEIIEWNQTKLKKGFQLGFTEHASNDYMQILFYSTEYSEIRGFWIYDETDITFNLIIPEKDILNHNKVLENKVAPLRNLSIQIWKKGLADVIQTIVEFDMGYCDIKTILCGEDVTVHPFAIIPENCIEFFDDDYFKEQELLYIENNGVLVNNNNFLPLSFI